MPDHMAACGVKPCTFEWASVLLTGALLLLIPCTGHAFSACPNTPRADTLTRTYHDTYSNPAYGFTVTIPPNLIGRDVDSPLYQRGFTILFSDPEESISVYADTNSLEWKDVSIAAKEYSQFFTEEARRVLSSDIVKTTLDGRPAIRITVSYTCKGSTTHYSSISTVSLSHDLRFVYTLGWEGREDELEAGKHILDSLMTSWRFHRPTS